MDAALAIVRIRIIQAALKVLVVLQLTAIYWPQQAIVPDGARYSFIIVGGGTAGCVIANRLSERYHFKVLLIEAGGDPPLESMLPGLVGYLPKTDVDWNYTEQYDEIRDIYQNGIELPLTQGKMLGGSSSNNYMIYARGHPHDFNTWANQVGDQSWNYNNVLPDFIKSERLDDSEILWSKYAKFHGTAGYMHISREPRPETKPYLNMFKDLGHEIRLDFNGDEYLGYGEPAFTISNGVRQSTAFSFLRPVKYRNNLHILKNTRVTKVLFDDYKNAIGVQALTQDRKLIKIMTDREVIVTAGAFNSAQLLMLSGIGPKKDLQSLGIKVVSDLPVGQNLKEHVASVQVYKMKRSNNPLKYPNYAEFPLPCITGYTGLNKTHAYPDVESICYIIPNNSDAALSMCSFNLGLNYNTCQAIYEAGKGRELLFCLQALLHPESHGVVELPSKNPEDNPLIYLRAYSEKEDLETMVKACEELDKIRSTSYYRSIDGEVVDLRLPKCKGLSYGTKAYWACHVLSTRVTLWNYIGACSMGRVVDSKLRVFGVRGLRVPDRCAIPVLPRANIAAAVVMVAEKGADMIKADNGDSDHFTFIIVGGGTAGCVLANRLSENSRFNVLLIEAGDDPPFESMVPGLVGYLPDTISDWKYVEQDDKNREIYQNGIRLPLTQGKMLGGSSGNNYMCYVRGHPHDYNSWAEKLGDPSWNYESVLPYFKKSENLKDPGIRASKYGKFHGTTGYLKIARSMDPKTKPYAGMFRELGHKIRIDFNGNETLGFGEGTFIIYKRVRQSTAYSFLTPVKHRQNLHVLKNTLVTKILFDDYNNATGVEALTHDGKLIRIMADKEVIVTAGAFNSPKLLMLSGIGPIKDLRSLGIKVVSDLPVGNYLKEQPAAIVAYKFKRLNGTLKVPNYGKYPFAALTGYISLNKSRCYPDTESICLIISGDSYVALSVCAFSFGLNYNTCQAIYNASKEREVLICIQILLHPKSSGRIRLKSKNPKDDPLISLRSYSEEEDLDTMVKSFEELDRIRTSSYYKSVAGEAIDLRLPKCAGMRYGSKAFWRCQTLSTRWSVWHYSSSCSMGRVVDSKLRVYGVQRLRVGDSSAMQNIPRSNIMGPVIMVAEKAADMIKADHDS